MIRLVCIYEKYVLLCFIKVGNIQIILNIPLETMESKPHVILFEHALLDKDSFHQAMKHLHDNYYMTCGFHHNIMAYDVQWMQRLDNVDYPAENY